MPTGNKLWRFSYRFGGKQKTMAMGVYPITTLADARGARDDAKRFLAKGADPSVEKKQAKFLASTDNTFKTIAEELIAKCEKEGRSERTIKKMRWILELVWVPS